MLPIIRVPEILAKGMESFRKIFCRAEGFEHICRFITGLILSPNKTLQGIYDLQVWEGEGRAVGPCMKRSLSQAGTVRRLSNSIGGKWLKPIKGEAAKWSGWIGHWPIMDVVPRFRRLRRVTIMSSDGPPCFRRW